MANKKQSEFPFADAFDGTETFGLIQAGINKKTLLSNIKNFALNNLTSSILTGLSLVTSSAVTASDSILVAIGKLQAQTTVLSNLLSGYNPRLVLGRSGAAVATTTSTSEETLAAITIPSGLMNTNGQVVVTALWSCTNSINDKTVRVRLGGISAAPQLENVLTLSSALQTYTVIRNRNSASSQVSYASGALITSTVDTSVATTIVITGQKALDSEDLVLESYTVEIIK